MSDLEANETGAAEPAWRERKNILLAAGVGVAILLLGGYFLLSGGSSEEDLGPVASASGARAGAAGATPSGGATPTAVATLPDESNDAVFGDPFAPIYPAVATAAAPASSASATTSGTTSTGNGATTAGGTSVTIPTTQAPAPSTPDSVPSEPNKTTKLYLVKVIDSDTVQVKVNGGATQTQNAGQTFGFFKLDSTRPGEGEATFYYGSDKFTMYVGETRTFS